MLMAQYNKLVAYLEEKEFHQDPELQALVDKLGFEAEEAEQEVLDLNEALTESLNGKRRYYGEEG